MLVKLILHSGNHAVYEVGPSHAHDWQLVRDYGEQIAVRNAGNWYRRGMRECWEPDHAATFERLPIGGPQ